MTSKGTDIAKIAQQAFNIVDSDKNGYVSYEELGECMKAVARKLGTPEPSDDQILQAVGALDTNKDGNISLEEFSVLVEGLLSAIIDLKEIKSPG